MGAVEDQFPATDEKPLEAARPCHLRKPLFHSLRSGIISRYADQGEGHGSIQTLMGSGKAESNFRGKRLTNMGQGSTLLPGNLGKDCLDLRLLRSDHSRDAGAKDPGLLTGNFGKRLPQPFRVIKGDRSDRAGKLRGSVGGIKSATETGLKHHHVATGTGKEVEGECGDELEKGRFIPLSPP